MADRFDTIVVGSGIAGLYAAITAADAGERVLVVTKGALEESNTRYAQGGIAVPLADGDAPELHARDTIAAGDGLCDGGAVAALTRDAAECLRDLIARGVPFDRENGMLAFTREAAHSVPRVVHAGGDATGAAIERSLARSLREAKVAVIEHALVTDVIVEEGAVAGVQVLLDEHEADGAAHALAIPAERIVLATGGAGQVFSRTTNPVVATGDGIALAYRAGASLMDLEFYQFHPTALALPGVPAFLITEAARGEGGILRDLQGNAFMASYHPDRELAPRDVVARAITMEMARQYIPHVLLDLTHLPAAHLSRRFPTIEAYCRRYGLDIASDPLPVGPAAHYYMGGVRTDLWGRTVVPGLLAVGEVACAGVHGANRLASNSLLEGLVFARRAARSAFDVPRSAFHVSRFTDRELTSRVRDVEVAAVGSVGGVMSRRGLQELAWGSLGVVREPGRLEAALSSVSRALQADEGLVLRSLPKSEHEHRNLLTVAKLLATSALLREESRGAHFRVDHPHSHPSWLGHIVLGKDIAYFVKQEAMPEREMLGV